jgi:hypothetical protein
MEGVEKPTGAGDVKTGPDDIGFGLMASISQPAGQQLRRATKRFLWFFKACRPVLAMKSASSPSTTFAGSYYFHSNYREARQPWEQAHHSRHCVTMFVMLLKT